MLVQTAWIKIINDDLPATSYAKLVDYWFTWHLLMAFLVILFHIILDKLNTRFSSFHGADVEPIESEIISNDLPANKANPNIEKLNKFGMAFLALVNCLFYGLYIALSIRN